MLMKTLATADQHAPLPSPARVAVIVATKGRPQASTHVLRLLEKQSVQPAITLFSACTEADIEPGLETQLAVEYIFGPAGLPAQRNRALATVLSRADFVVFFDDDFVPSPYWIERCLQAFLAEPDVAGISGALLHDGAVGAALSWDDACSLVRQAEAVAGTPRPLTTLSGLYGCNMAYRVSAIGNLRFDERLVLYGWLEDKDFSRAIGRKGRLVESDAMLGVHLGLRSGRVSGKRFGFSQIVNAWYLHKKGVLSTKEVWSFIAKALTANGVRSIRPESHIDRRGRFAGNLVGVTDLLLGRCRPERASDL